MLVEVLLNVYLPFCAVVATDDEKIRECCRSFGADVIMTSESCRNGRHHGFLFSFFFSFAD